MKKIILFSIILLNFVFLNTFDCLAVVSICPPGNASCDMKKLEEINNNWTENLNKNIQPATPVTPIIPSITPVIETATPSNTQISPNPSSIENLQKQINDLIAKIHELQILLAKIHGHFHTVLPVPHQI